VLTDEDALPDLETQRKLLAYATRLHNVPLLSVTRAPAQNTPARLPRPAIRPPDIGVPPPPPILLTPPSHLPPLHTNTPLRPPPTPCAPPYALSTPLLALTTPAAVYIADHERVRAPGWPWVSRLLVLFSFRSCRWFFFFPLFVSLPAFSFLRSLFFVLPLFFPSFRSFLLSYRAQIPALFPFLLVLPFPLCSITQPYCITPFLLPTTTPLPRILLLPLRTTSFFFAA
jgi:hypothetical protein